MATRSNDFVFDELLCFLSNPLFQVPVLSFMENHCLTFDTSTEDSAEYRGIHNQYRTLVDALLEAFRSDTGLTHDQIVEAMKNLNAKPELRKVFQELFEQVLAMDDFPIFVHLMMNKNLELQKQALMLITMMHGQLPNSLQEGGGHKPSALSNTKQDEDEVLKAVLEQSRREYEAQQRQSQKEEEDYRAVLNISQVESQRLDQASKHGQEKLSQVMKSSMRISDEPSATQGVAGGLAAMGPLPTLPKEAANAKPAAPAKAAMLPPPVAAAAPASSPQKPVPVISTPASKPAPMVAKHDLAPLAGAGKGRSSKDAAADWLKAAESEVKSSEAHSQAVYAAAASMAGMSQEEYQKRVNFLKQQRDKLMEMKRKEREKQLLSAASSQPARPASARAARNALSQAEASAEPAAPSEEDKKLAMRKAIANRIKSELMGKK
ncbi:hypothetical protein V1264_018485 [Littorina saxatilis]|uniref:Cilia- and flagella-associated protein 36 n=1 Tax=Littorina saxatilis TaxID=31220 RepID=A0AAN9BEC3_9CAEN